MTKRALISVWNKDKLVEFATELVEKYDYEIVATGSTFDLLKQNNIKATEISEITGKRQLINGKVKTLHPAVFAGILADTNNDIEKAGKYKLAKKTKTVFDEKRLEKENKKVYDKYVEQITSYTLTKSMKEEDENES